MLVFILFMAFSLYAFLCLSYIYSEFLEFSVNPMVAGVENRVNSQIFEAVTILGVSRLVMKFPKLFFLEILPISNLLILF